MRPERSMHVNCVWSRVMGHLVRVAVSESDAGYWVRIAGLTFPIIGTPEGREARAFMESVLEECFGDLSLVLDFDRDGKLIRDEETNSVEGDIWLGESLRLSEAVVNAGHATRVAA